MAKMASLYEETTRQMATLITEDEWLEKYQPTTDTPLADYGEDLRTVRLTPRVNVWTLIEEDEKLSIVNGLALVNRIGHYLTYKPWDIDDEIVVEVR